MKNNVNSLAIGMFVLGAALLSVAVVIIFGAANFSQNQQMLVSPFYETVNGLDVGAPVKFKGVKIGKVERIAIGEPTKDKQSGVVKDTVVVIYSIDMNLLQRRMRDANRESGDDWLQAQIKGGLRSKLMYQSIVTGMLYIELDYLEKPNQNLKIKRGKRGGLFIPSVSSGLQELVKSVQDSIAEISQIDFKKFFADTSVLVENTNVLVVSLNEKISFIDTKTLNERALASITKTEKLLDGAGILIDSANKTALKANSFMDSTSTSFTTLSAEAQKTLANIDVLVKNLNKITAPNSSLSFELSKLLRSMNDSMNAINNLTEFLQRNPDAILTGKSQNKSGKE